jgi:hypothetical protein
LLVAAREAAKQEPKESKQVGMKEALVALAIFCDEALRRQEDEGRKILQVIYFDNNLVINLQR